MSRPASVAPAAAVQGAKGFWRPLLLGLLLVLLISFGAPYSIWMVGSSEITWSYFPIGVGVPFLLVVGLNLPLKRLAPSWALRPHELVIGAVMGLVASGIPIFVAGYILAIVSKPYYGATPENAWADYIQPHLPTWAIPTPERQVMRHFYEGLPAGHPIPWEVWIGPLAWWMSLILAIYTACFCLVALLRKQWVDHERLVFPLIEMPRLLVEEKPGSLLPPLLANRLFWIGCAVPLGAIVFNMLAYFQPGFPQLPVHQEHHTLALVDGAPALKLILYFPVVGFVYLVGTGISFSIWFFYLATTAQMGLVHWLGLTAASPDPFVWNWHTLSWQSYGAFCAMVLWSLWMARRHLAMAVRTAFTGAPDDGESEILSYRTAMLTGLLAIAYILFWLLRSGMALHVAALYLAATLLMFIGLTRLVIQAGLHYLTAPLVSQALPLAVFGSAMAPQGVVALALSYSCFGDVESVFMPSAAHAARLKDFFGNRRTLFLALGLAVITGFVATVYFMLYLCYTHGAGNFRSWFFQPGAGAGGIVFDAAVRQMRDPWPVQWVKLVYFGLGAALYSFIAFCQYRFFWWSLHPVGLTIASTWMVRRIALSVFLAWLLKSAILRLGGVGLYRLLKPFFIGLIVGFFLGVGLSYAVDLIWFFGKGHPILHG